MHKNKFKWFKDLNIRPETKKLLEENLSNVLFDFGLSNFFFFWIFLLRQGKQKQK